jgi:molybdenum cofactor cytidylyltransferase
MINDNTEWAVYAIILAAGESRRFSPQNKLFLPCGHETILEASVRNILNSRVDGTVVVVGHQADRVEKLLGKFSSRLVFNPDYRKGMGSSVVVGIDYWLERIGLSPSAGFLFALGDQPFIPPAVIDDLIGKYRDTGADIVTPVFQGRRGHPSIFNRKYANEIREVAGRWGAREILLRHPDKILSVPVETGAIIRDIDTPEGYEAALDDFM